MSAGTQVQAVTTPRPAEEQGSEIMLVSFRLGTEEFGIDIAKVQEILRLPDITPIPRSPEHLTGITNIRGSILPVINAKIRLKLTHGEADERNRVLVVSHAGSLTGMIVDEVHEVMRIDSRSIEPPPPVTRGIDRFFLSGIVKLDGERLVMMLNLDEFLHVEVQRQESQQLTSRETAAAAEAQVVRQEQLVSFFLGTDEFAFDIAAVHEIIRAREITAVPNVPDFVVGIQTLRDTILPVIDLRRIVQKEALGEESRQRIRQLIASHAEWSDALERAVKSGVPFDKPVDPRQCALGQMLEDRQRGVALLGSSLFGKLNSRIRPPHNRLHDSARQAMQWAAGEQERVREGVVEVNRSAQSQVTDILEEAHVQVLDSLRREQKVLVVESRGTTFGLLVDRINEVLRIAADSIDSTPALISGYGRELKGVAKLDGGGRLIMMLDEHAVISQQEAEALSQIGEHEKRGAQKKTEQVDKSQLVVFTIHGEEFGVAIDRVREIFKISDITPVPKAPEFVAGLTNLRGTIIPVINVRRRFGMVDVQREFHDTLAEVDRRFQGLRQALQAAMATGAFDEARRVVEHAELGSFLDGFQTTNDGLSRRVAELQAMFLDLQAEILKSVQMSGRNRDRGQELFDGPVQADIARFEAHLQAARASSGTDLLREEKILVVAASGLAIGLLVDSVHEVVSVPLSAIEPTPDLVLDQVESAYLDGIAKLNHGQRMILLLNIDEILSKAQFEKLLKLQVGAEAEAAGAPSPATAPRREPRRKLKIEE